MRFKGIGQADKRSEIEKVKDFLRLPNNRAKQRKIARAEAPVNRTRSTAPGISPCRGAKPVKRQSQIAIEFRREQRTYLLKIKLFRLLRECPEMRFILGATNIRNAWALSQADTLTIAAIPGLGSVRAGKLYAYLVGKGFPVAWNPNVRVVR